MKIKQGKQTGFTLIELVVVIAIIGILAAIALPRYAALQADARMAKMNAALGSIKAATVMAHALLVVRGYPADYTGNPAAPDINIEGVDAVFERGYPDSATIAALAGLAAPDYTLTSTATAAAITPDAFHPACSVVYTEPAAAGLPPSYDNTNLTIANCS